MKKAAYSLLRWVALVEGISFILLLGVAMPLKYYAGMPELVYYVGWAHGYLFLAFIGVLLVTLPILRWSPWRGMLLLLASLLPLGTILTDGRVRRWWGSQAV